MIRFTRAVIHPRRTAVQSLRFASARKKTQPTFPAALTTPAAVSSAASAYQRKTPVEHVLLRPGMYVGDTSYVSSGAFVFDGSRMRRQDACSFNPGLLKIFDEVLVNACDNCVRTHHAALPRPPPMSRLEVSIDPGDVATRKPPRITVTNDGGSLPIALHPTEGIFIPELVFGNLLTGSNFDDSAGSSALASSGGKVSAAAAAKQASVTGGRHGYGAKLTNIFSLEFTVETADGRQTYLQTWRNNMRTCKPPVVTAGATGSYTRVSFVPDLARFAAGRPPCDPPTRGEFELDAGTLSLMRRRVVDAAGTLSCVASSSAGAPLPPLQVILDGATVPVRSFAEYAELHRPAGAGPPAGSASATPRRQRGVGKAAAATTKATLVASGAIASPAAAAATDAEDLAAACAALGAFVHGTVAVGSHTWHISVGSAGVPLPAADVAAPPAPAAAAAALADLAALNRPGVVSFVNSVATARGGTHAAAVVEALCRRVAALVAKRAPSGLAAAVTPAAVRPHLRLWLNAWVELPAFDSQSKDALTTPIALQAATKDAAAAAAAGSGSAAADAALLAAALPDKLIRQIVDELGVATLMLAEARARAAADEARSLKRATRGGDARLRGLTKLEDANWAGGKRGHECALVVTEGDSAKALAVAGLAVVGRDRFGVFPLRGKLLNVRGLTATAAMANAEVAALVAILGLDFSKTYEGLSPADRSLRYGKLLVMADQDVDGSHIKGLVLNLFDTFWPALLRGGGGQQPAEHAFVQSFVTPIIKARAARGGATREFFSVPEFEAWRRAGSPAADADAATHPPPVGLASASSWSIKYYKGLGTSTSAEGRAYFSALHRHVRPFVFAGEKDADRVSMAFSKGRVEERKAWLAAAAADPDLVAVASEAVASVAAAPPSATSAKQPPPPPLPQHLPPQSLGEFIDDDLIEFSRSDLLRSIPSVIDGLKPSQRKVLFACFKRAGAAGGSGALSGAAGLDTGEGGRLPSEEEGGLSTATDPFASGTAAPSVKRAPGKRPAAAAAGAAAGAHQHPRALLPPASALGAEVKVAQLAGYVAECTAYHHGEASLISTIVGMAQDFVGANNVPLLQPLGQFGTRLQGGKDAASARYIFTRLAPLARLLMPAEDDPLLRRREDDGQAVEPLVYVPVVPLALLNGAQGIGTGWSTLVPPHHPVLVVDAVLALLSAWEQRQLQQSPLLVSALAAAGASWTGLDAASGSVAQVQPWWRGFRGSITAAAAASPGHYAEAYTLEGRAEWVRPPTAAAAARAKSAAAVSTASKKRAALLRASVAAAASVDGDDDEGEEAVGGGNASAAASSSRSPLYTPCAADEAGGHVHISELPVGTWVEAYKAFLAGLVDRGSVRSLHEHHTDAAVDFIVQLTPQGEAEAAADGGGLLSYLHLRAPFSTRNMHCFGTGSSSGGSGGSSGSPSGSSTGAGGIVRYSRPAEVLAEFMPVRLGLYAARKARGEAALRGQLGHLAAVHRFLSEVVAGSLQVSGRSRAALVLELRQRGYPVQLREGATAAVAAGASTTALCGAAAAPFVDVAALDPGPHFAEAAAPPPPPAAVLGTGFDYLLQLPLWRLTADSMQATAARSGAAQARLQAAQRTSALQLWRADLQRLRGALLLGPEFRVGA